MVQSRSIRVAYTPDSDDAFSYFAWEHGHVSMDGIVPEFRRAPISELNAAAEAGEFDVVAVSSAYYPRIVDDYAILTVGNSIGRHCGPVLVAKEFRTTADLHGKRLGVGGHPTTGSCLAKMYVPGAQLVTRPFESIIDEVASGELDAGVMIHEEIVSFRDSGLHLVCDLGAAFCEDTGLPLPVGLNVIRRGLGGEGMRAVATACERSVSWGLAHPGPALEHASRFGRGRAREHLSMFKDSDTLRLPEDARRGVGAMVKRIADMQLGPTVHSLDFVEGEMTVEDCHRVAGASS